MIAPHDRDIMRRALDLARRGRGSAAPNPLVGAIVARDERIIADGFHERAGGPHAEALALDRAAERARGATLYLTLEPCVAHEGKRTPPCAPRVVASGVARVVIAQVDPNPAVAGRGIEALRAAGVAVEVGLLEDEARRLNARFAKWVTTGLPFVVLKWAMSLDGRIATRTGDSRWITSEEARAEAHAWRGDSDAVVVGSGTALRDDPMLTRRHGAPGRDPQRVVVDSTARLPLESALVRTAREHRTLVCTTDRAPEARTCALRERGVEVAMLAADAMGRVDARALVAHLARAASCTQLLVEGGATLAASLLEADQVDRVVAFIAPLLVGGAEAKGPLGGGGPERIADALHLRDLSVARVGPDVMLVGDVSR